MIASQNDYLEIVKALIRAGANKEAADVQEMDYNIRNGMNSLMIAVKQGKTDIVYALLTSGAKKETTNTYNNN